MKEGGEDRLEHATYQPGDYGRMIRPDGTEQWGGEIPARAVGGSPAPAGRAE